MASENLDIVVSLVDRFSAGMKNVRTSLKSSLDGARELGAVFTVAGGAIAAASVFAIKNASDLNESINAVNVVFGEAAGSLLKYGETADQIGLSQNAFNQAVVPIGSLLQNVGFSAQAAADSSQALIQRAADMSSVFNTSLSESLTAIQAGLRGEADPLERFGVGLNEAAIKAYAVAQGFISSGQEMDNQTKTVARLGLLFEQTNRVSGDYANTSMNLANLTRTLKAQFENLSAQLGKALMPIIEKLYQQIVPVLKSLNDWIQKNPELAAKITIVVAAIGAALVVLGPLLLLLSALPSLIAGVTFAAIALSAAWVFMTGPVGILIAVLAGLIAIMVGLRARFPEAWNAMVDAMESAVQYIVDVLINGLIDGFNALQHVLGNTNSDIQHVTVSLNALKAETAEYGPFLNKVGTAGESVNTTFTGMEGILANAGAGMGGAGKAAKDSSKELADAMEKMGDSAEQLKKDIDTSLSAVIEKISDLQGQMEELLVGKVQDTNDERTALAQAYVDEEQKVSDLRMQISEEEDAKKRRELQEKLNLLQADLEANKTVEAAVAAEITKIHRDATKTDLQLAKEKFQQNILMIEQQFEKKYTAIQAELMAELDKANQLIKIRDEASKKAQEIELNGETKTVESVNRQIEAFNRLAQAIQNAKQGITTSTVSLGATTTAQEKLKSLTEQTPISITINNPQVLNDQDIVSKIGDPIMKALQQHAAVA